MHDAGDGRAQLDAAQLVLGGDAALGELGDARLDLAQLALRLALARLVDVEDLQLGLADLRARARDLRDERTVLAGDARLVAFHGEHSRHRRQAALVHVAHARELLAYSLNSRALAILQLVRKISEQGYSVPFPPRA